jgi:hypothetical protein
LRGFSGANFDVFFGLFDAGGCLRFLDAATAPIVLAIAALPEMVVAIAFTPIPVHIGHTICACFKLMKYILKVSPSPTPAKFIFKKIDSKVECFV